MLDHQLLKTNRTRRIEKMNSKEIYSIIISSKVDIPTSRIYFEKKKFLSINLNGKTYTLPRKVTINACLRSFQYKIRNNVLYLNKKLHTFGLSSTITFFLQNGGRDMQDIWNQVQAYFTDCLHFSQLAPQTSIFDFYDIDNDTFLMQNHILRLLKLHKYNSRKHGKYLRT